ncbi:MAG: DUF4365 domain-containing protein [Byssovorax sp.]
MASRTKVTAGTKPGRRYSREAQQEDRSEHQIGERFAELGWPCDRLGRDLGEDLQVRIYDEGRTTGLSFLVQLKSAADAERLRRKKSPALGYRLETKDLLHWEVSATLVVLMVWDVEKREGWWRAVPEIVGELDGAGKEWRKKKTATVTVPLANTTDAEGMKQLRWVVADHALPVVPKQDNAFSIDFADSDQGVEARRALERALDLGEPIIFEQGLIPTIKFPSWHRRIYGSAGHGELVKLEIRPSPDKTPKAVRIEIESPEGPASFPYVELRRTVQGRKRLVLTNEHQKLPLVFSFEFESERMKFSFRQVGVGNTPYEARDVAAFMLAGTAPGSMLRVINLEDGKALTSPMSSRSRINYDPAAMRRWRDVLDKICFIQQRAIGHGAVSPEALHNVTNADVDDIECVFHIFREGRVEVVKSISFEVAPSAEQIPDVRCVVRFDFREVRVNILDMDIPLGDARATVIDSDRYMEALRAAHAQANATGKAVLVRLEDLHIVEEYLDWPRPSSLGCDVRSLSIVSQSLWLTRRLLHSRRCASGRRERCHLRRTPCRAKDRAHRHRRSPPRPVPPRRPRGPDHPLAPDRAPRRPLPRDSALPPRPLRHPPRTPAHYSPPGVDTEGCPARSRRRDLLRRRPRGRSALARRRPLHCASADPPRLHRGRRLARAHRASRR